VRTHRETARVWADFVTKGQVAWTIDDRAGIAGTPSLPTLTRWALAEDASACASSDPTTRPFHRGNASKRGSRSTLGAPEKIRQVRRARAKKTMHTPHIQCPHHCDHPQPFTLADGRQLCGACWFRERKVTEMVVCDGSNEEACEFREAHAALSGGEGG